MSLFLPQSLVIPTSAFSFSRRRRPTPPPPLRLAAAAATPNPTPESKPKPKAIPKAKPKSKSRRTNPKPEARPASPPDPLFPAIKPRKPRRGRPGETAAVEDFVRGTLERTFASIRAQNQDVLADKHQVLKPQDEAFEEEEEEVLDESSMVVEEEAADWPLDAEVGWGVRASEYFDEHPIKNVVVDGVEIDWEGELDDGWVKEINCLEWESFAFHPSPLMVLVFERYNRAADNWKLLKELEKAAKVYWSAKDRLPPRMVKIDINIEKDLAYALKVKECPQLLFLKGNRILYREKEIRTADELVQMIAHFYYNARRPSWIDSSMVAPF